MAEMADLVEHKGQILSQLPQAISPRLQTKEGRN